MGCDIHPHIEVKIADKWEHYSCPQIDRHYKLFEKICGVRGEVKNAIAPPRGLPDDASVVTKLCYQYEDSHSATYLTQAEFVHLIKWYDDFMRTREAGWYSWEHQCLGYITGNSFDLGHGGHPPEIQDVRFICWFDN